MRLVPILNIRVKLQIEKVPEFRIAMLDGFSVPEMLPASHGQVRTSMFTDPYIDESLCYITHEQHGNLACFSPDGRLVAKIPRKRDGQSRSKYLVRKHSDG